MINITFFLNKACPKSSCAANWDKRCWWWIAGSQFNKRKKNHCTQFIFFIELELLFLCCCKSCIAQYKTVRLDRTQPNIQLNTLHSQAWMDDCRASFGWPPCCETFCWSSMQRCIRSLINQRGHTNSSCGVLPCIGLPMQAGIKFKSLTANIQGWWLELLHPVTDMMALFLRVPVAAAWPAVLWGQDFFCTSLD